MEKEVLWHCLNKKEILIKLKTEEKGITNYEAKVRLEKYGRNELKQKSKISPFLIFIQQFKSLFILILIAAAIFSFVIKHYIDFGVIMVIVLLNSIIGFFQQYHAEKIIAEMKEVLVQKVKVMRSGKLEEIFSYEIVPGDILVLSEGDKIMADCRIIDSNELETNEAVLTGESFPQNKSSIDMKNDAELANRENILYMGTSIVSGNGKAVVFATGMNTEFGKIANLVQTIETKKTPLEQKLDSFAKKISVIVLFLAGILILIGINRGENIYDMFLIGVALAISVIPEGIPAVIAVILSIAIKNMKKSNVLIRKLSAAETLGRVTVICTDKTGTLTEEEMTVTKLYCNKGFFDIKENLFYDNHGRINPLNKREIFELLKVGIMCNNARIEKEDGIKIYGDPTEKAFVMSAEKAKIFKKEETEKEKKIIEYSFSSKRKLMSIVRKKDNNLISYVKGAPEIILKRCDRELLNGRTISMSQKRKNEIISAYEKMASDSLRVLGFAFKEFQKKPFNQEIAESHLVFVGFQGVIDPPRKEVKNSIKDCINAGIKIKMITGDSILTAKAVSRMISLEGEAINGPELEKLSENEFGQTVRNMTIFAQVTPELKFRIIQKLIDQKEIVAVTGDGVNDVLALKEAHIGVAMGIRGTDVTRESSDIILLDDNFASIVKAVREGRRVYDNLKKSIKFHLAANVDELLVILFAFIFSFPIPLMPLAILWMNLITDSLPSISLSVEKEEENIMKRKPKNPEETILHGIIQFVLIAGIISAIATLGLFFLFYEKDLEKARTIALSVSVFCELFLIFTCRSENKNVWEIGIFSNKFLIYSVVAAFILQIIAIYTPLSTVFGFKPLSWIELLLVVIASSIGLIFFETIKFIKKKKK